MPIGYILCLFVLNNNKNISSRKSVDLFSSLFKKIILDVTTPTSQEVGGVTQSLIFCLGHILSKAYFLMVSRYHHQID